MKLLFLHGFASSPRELRPLGLYLAKCGYESMAPLLPGHGERLPGMSCCDLHDWIEAVHLSYESLRRDGSPVAVIGYCLGGALALATAHDLNPRSIVCLATPVFRIKPEFFPALTTDELAFHTDPERPGELPTLLGTRLFTQDSVSALTRRWKRLSSHPNVSETFFELYQKVIDSARNALSGVNCPLAMVEGAQDRIVDARSAGAVAEAVSSDFLHTIRLDGAAHALPIEPSRLNLAKEVSRFLALVESSESKTF